MSKKKPAVLLPATHRVAVGPVVVSVIKGFGDLFIENLGCGKPRKTDNRCFQKQARVSHIGIDTKGSIYQTIDCSIEELEAFVKDARKAHDRFAKAEQHRHLGFFRHFSPDLSFFIKPKGKRK